MATWAENGGRDLPAELFALPSSWATTIATYVCTNITKFVVDVWAIIGFPHLLSWLLNT